MKGWYGNRRQHSLASKGIRTKMCARGLYDYTVEKIEKGDYRLIIMKDENPESPREWDNIGHMVAWHDRYSLGDYQPNESAEDWMEELGEMYGDKVLILPLYLYDHSGITMNTTGYSHMGMYGYFDSGQVGWIYITHEDIKKEFGDAKPETIAKVKTYLEGEVETYDDYIRGNVYGFMLEKRKHCSSCEHDEWEDVDSCWGFYGDWRKSGIGDHLDNVGRDLFGEIGGEL